MSVILGRFESCSEIDGNKHVADNWVMEISGHVENGVVVLDGAMTLPEGTRVCVSYPVGTPLRAPAAQRPVELPIFPYAGTPDIDLTNDDIAEILDRDDASA